jgi:CheY-like chemotaxis protein
VVTFQGIGHHAGEKTNIKILVVTGYPERIDEMMRLGADSTLAKPFKSAQLI